MSVSDRIREVLEQHPFIVGEGWYAGEIICNTCHLCTDPSQHLRKFLAEALDPDYVEPQPVSSPVRAPGQKESTIGWED